MIITEKSLFFLSPFLKRPTVAFLKILILSKGVFLILSKGVFLNVKIFYSKCAKFRILFSRNMPKNID